MIMNWNKIPIKHLLACGDLHGKLQELVFKLHAQYGLQDAVCFCAGDIGLGFYKENYYRQLFEELNSKLVKSNNTLCFIRGNHDDPDYWKAGRFSYSNIIFVPDYTLVHFMDTTILCIGGAVSVDRALRTEGKDYWTGEGFQYKEPLLEGLNPDVVITHSAPHICFPYTKEGIVNWMEKDCDLQQDIDVERSNHSLVYEQLKRNGAAPSQWIYGHFHSSHTDYHEQTKFMLLNELEVYEIK
jgi:predicted phosphodiesterase